MLSEKLATDHTPTMISLMRYIFFLNLLPTGCCNNDAKTDNKATVCLSVYGLHRY